MSTGPAPTTVDIGEVLGLVDHVFASATSTRALTYGPVPLRLSGVDDAELDDIAAHLAASATPSWRPLDIAVVTGDTVDEALLPAPLRPAERISVLDDPDVLVLASGAEGYTWFLDERRARAIRWTRGGTEIPRWEQIGPLRAAGRWWAAHHDAALIHTGAVADDRGAVLLVGDAGAGKSTSTLACIGSGLDVLGDDFCFVDCREPGRPEVHAAYRLAKLTPQSLALLPHLRERVVGTGLREKALIQLDNVAVAHRPIRAVCHVVQTPGEPTRTRPLARAAALRAVAPSTMFHLRTHEREMFTALAATVRTASCFELRVGPVDTIAGVIDRLLDEVTRP